MHIRRATRGLKVVFGAALAAAAGLLAAHEARAAIAFTPGNVIVTRAVGGTTGATEAAVGAPGSGPLLGSGVTAAVFIDEYTPAGVPTGNSVVLPYNSTQATGGNNILTFSGTQNGEGAITTSYDGQYFVLAGYKSPAFVATATTGGSNGAVATSVNRIIGLVDMNGVFDTTTALQDVSSAASFRSAFSTNGTDLWANGSNGGNVTVGPNTYTSSGIRYTTRGSTTSTQIQATSSNGHRVLNGFNNQLMLGNSGSPAANRGVNVVDTNFAGSTVPGATLTGLPGFSATTDQTNDFFFADANTLYTTDIRTDGVNGGVRKFIFNSGTGNWEFKYNVTLGASTTTAGANVGGAGLAGTVDGLGNAVLYVTTFDGAGANTNRLDRLVDLISGSTAADQANTAASLTVLATSAANSAFRGVEIVPIPEPATVLSLVTTAGLAALSRRRR